LAATREYELVLMLDPGQNPAARDAVANEAKGQIEAAGTLKHENAWGLRKLAYEIAQRNEADYRWFRFEAQPPLLEQLDHNLKIADGVLRFRVFKVDAETPVMVPPATGAPGPAASREHGDDGPPPIPAEESVAEVPSEPAAEATEPEAATPEPAAEPEPADSSSEDGDDEPTA
jgi:small subunit ribosomal protein S6